jgi:dCMP deaminase
MEQEKWTRRWIELAKHVAGWSKDPSTKVGAVIVGTRPGQIAVGYNGFPRGVADTEERLNDRSTKYKLIQHAERNALDNATFDLFGATLVVTKAPCSECAKSIIQKGIVRVVCPPTMPDDRWVEEANLAAEIMQEVDIWVDYEFFETPEVQWHREQGGHDGRLAGHALRLLHEAVELCVAAGAQRHEIEHAVVKETIKAEFRKDFRVDVGPGVSEEIADVQLLLNVFSHYAQVTDVRPLLDRKMKINHERKWEVDADGVLWRPKNVNGS